MITTKLYYKLILFLPFFLSLSSLASVSLKVKRTEYYEDGKLVRAIYYDDKYSMKVKEVFIDYTYGFEGRVQNKITLTDIENGKYVLFKTYHVNIIGESVFFYNPDNYSVPQF